MANEETDCLDRSRERCAARGGLQLVGRQQWRWRGPDRHVSEEGGPGLGFLENITHAPALIGVRNGFFAKNLGSSVTLQLHPHSTGTEEATTLLAGQLDAAYVGPNPAIKAWQQSNGSLIKVISGAASGGAQLVVKNGITSASQLRGQKLATPSLGSRRRSRPG